MEIMEAQLGKMALQLITQCFDEAWALLGKSGALEGGVGPLEGVVGPLEGVVGPLEGVVGPLEGVVAPLEGVVAPLEGVVAPLEGVVAPLEGVVAPLEGVVAPLEGVVAPLEGVVAPLEGVVAPLEGVVGPLEGVVGPLEGGVGPLEGVVAPLEGGVGPLEGVVGPLEGVVGPLEGVVGPLEAADDQPPIAMALPEGETPRFKQSSKELLRKYRDGVEKVVISETQLLDVHGGMQCCTMRIRDMQQVALRDLRLGKSVKGRYVILRSLMEPSVNKCMSTIVEDEAGTAAFFALYMFNAAMDETSFVEDIIPIATVFMLKEPFCTQTEEQDCVLHCYSPSNMIVVHERLDLLKMTKDIEWKTTIADPVFCACPNNPNCWKIRGMTLLRAGEITQAIRCHMKALSLMSREYSNERRLLMDGLYMDVKAELSLLYICRGLYDEALVHAQGVWNVNSYNKNALIGLAVACLHLKRHSEALVHFKDYHRVWPECTDGSETLELLEPLVLAQQTGNVNLDDFRSWRCYWPLDSIDLADYTGPVTLHSWESKGRGLVATRDIDPGTLLLASRALAFSWKEDINEPLRPECWKDLVAQLALRINRNPKTFGPMIYNLHDGKNPAGATFRVFCDEDDQLEPIVDVKKLKGIILTNAFGESNNLHHMDSIFLKSPVNVSGCGVFHVPSFLNHSCLPNASVHQYNDVLVVIAAKSIRSGEEVCISYISCEFPFLTRAEYCAVRGFICKCQLCQLDRLASMTHLVERQNIFGRCKVIEEIIAVPDKYQPSHLRDINRLLEELEATLPTVLTYPQSIAKVATLSLRATVYSLDTCDDPRRKDKEIDDLKKMLSLLGFDVDEMMEAVQNDGSQIPTNGHLDQTTISVCNRLYSVYNKHKMIESARTWEEIYCRLKRVYNGLL